MVGVTVEKWRVTMTPRDITVNEKFSELEDSRLHFGNGVVNVFRNNPLHRNTMFRTNAESASYHFGFWGHDPNNAVEKEISYQLVVRHFITM